MSFLIIKEIPPTLDQRKNIKLDSRERSSEFRKLYEITGVVGVGGGGTVYAGKIDAKYNKPTISIINRPRSFKKIPYKSFHQI